MSKVALIIEELGSHRLNAINALRRIDGVSIRDISSSVGKMHPVFVRNLFSRDDPDFPFVLCSLLVQMEKMGVPYELYELLDDQSFAYAERSKYFRITSDRLKNMITTREQSADQQRRLGELGL